MGILMFLLWWAFCYLCMVVLWSIVYGIAKREIMSQKAAEAIGTLSLVVSIVLYALGWNLF
ncbi:hypothetical protein FWF93_03020 [Candidatus Saccharibacteria bacterium]|nr:hypothetical protein [Candidatus Saccharibacteria bacterium]